LGEELGEVTGNACALQQLDVRQQHTMHNKSLPTVAVLPMKICGNIE
jgi:hypothetical protein